MVFLLVLFSPSGDSDIHKDQATLLVVVIRTKGYLSRLLGEVSEEHIAAEPTDSFIRSSPVPSVRSSVWVSHVSPSRVPRCSGQD